MASMLSLDFLHGEMLLRGAVAGLLLFHVVQLALPGARPAARLALGGFTASVFAYVFCQQTETLLNLPRGLAYALLALCVGTTAWLWLSARALFDDGFRFGLPEVAALAALVALGLAANLPYFPDGDGPYRVMPEGSPVHGLNQAHALAMLGFTAAALWVLARGWAGDLVETRRSARRWVALGVASYAAVALVVELAVRGENAGRLLPALHIAGIGAVALALAVWVSRHSLAELLGADPHAPADPAPLSAAAPPAVADPVEDRQSRALARLEAAMQQDRAYRREGLTLADLAGTLAMPEAALRTLINQRLGFRNFNDFLHHHRLQEAAARIAQEDLPVLSIALDCGYGSIGPFNRAFKQRLGMTPTEYRAAARLTRAGATN
jgi:AraC-like DNA-binding protein